jgi:hypothetical protein
VGDRIRRDSAARGETGTGSRRRITIGFVVLTEVLVIGGARLASAQGCTPDPNYICVSGQDCGMVCSNINVLDVDQAPCPDPHTTHPGCGYGGGTIFGTEPEVSGVRYWVDPGCDPQGPTNCTVHAGATVRSRGNN